MLVAKNPRILNFYKENEDIDFEKVNLFFVDSLEKIISNKTPLNHSTLVQERFQDFNMNLCKKTFEIPSLLNQLFSTGEVVKHTSINENFDTFILKRNVKYNIMFGSIDVNRNATTEEVEDFYKMVQEKKCHGVFINQKAGISGKPNYFIDYIHGNIIVSIHQMEYNSDKIKVAIDIIDNISPKLKELNNNSGDFTIQKSILDDINKEYQLFLTQKEAVITLYKDCQKKVLAQFDEIRFPCLDKYLSTKFVSQPLKPGHKCDLCKSFNANNLKALAAHKRGCIRKNVFIYNNKDTNANTLMSQPLSILSNN